MIKNEKRINIKRLTKDIQVLFNLSPESFGGNS